MNFKANTLTAITALVVGVVILIYAGQRVTDVVLFIVGLAFVVPGIVTLLGLTMKSSAENHSGTDRVLRCICGIGGLGLGIVIWCLPGVFSKLLVYLYGIMLIAGGITQCIQLSRKSRAAGYPGWLIVGPLIILVAGVVLIVLDIFHHQSVEGSLGSEKWVMITTGVGAVIYGLNGIIITSYAYGQHRHDVKAQKAQTEISEGEYTEAAEIEKHVTPTTEPAKEESTSDNHPQ